MKTKYFISLLFSSCEKDESLYAELGDGTQLHKVLIGGEVYAEYSHNDAGLILEEKSKYHYSKYFYNSINQLARSDHYCDESIASSSSYVLEEAMNRTEWVSPENTERDTYSTLEYDNSGRLKKVSIHQLNDDSESYSSYLSNIQGRIEKKTSFRENQVSIYEKYFYDSNGNLIKKERYNDAEELQTTTEYEFDNHPNPYLSFRGLMLPGRNTNQNNITKEIYTLHFEVDDFVEKVQVTVNDYEYNSTGYPECKNETWEYVYY